MRAGIYIRVSSAEQAEEGYSIQAQTEKLEAYCKARDWVLYKAYTDPGFTGANINRPALQDMITDIKQHKIDIVVVYKLDRFSRSQKDCINMLDDILLPNNCDFVSINENFDTSTPYGRAMIGILSVFAQLERETIRERTVMGRIERAKGGLYSGNSHTPIGYDYIDGKLVINEYEAMQIREMYDMYINGISAYKIFNTFREKGYTTKHGPWSGACVIRRLMKSRLYIGELKYKDGIYEGQHEPIVTKEIWDKAQAVNELLHKTSNGYRKAPFTSTHILTGLLYCGSCGARMHAKKRSVRMYSEYLCYSFSKQSYKYITDRNCKPHIWPCWELEEMVLEEVKNLTFKSIKEQQKNKDNPNKQTFEKRINEINRNLNKLMDLYLIDGISKENVEKKSKQLSEEKQLLEKQLEKNKPTIKAKEAYQIVKDIDIIMGSDDIESKKKALSVLIDRIIVYDKHIEIKWTF